MAGRIRIVVCTSPEVNDIVMTGSAAPCGRVPEVLPGRAPFPMTGLGLALHDVLEVAPLIVP